jgi:AraC-like DNA-binding protein
VRLTEKKLRGPRKATKGRRDLERTRDIIARWPRDGDLIESPSPLLICVLAGRTDFRAGETEIHCGEGSFLLLPPGLPHDGARPHYHYDPQHLTAQDFCSLLWFERQGRIIRCWTCHSEGAVHGSLPAEQSDFLNDAANQLLTLLFSEAESEQAAWQTLGRHYLRALLMTLRRDLCEGNTLRLNINHPLSAAHSAPGERQADAIEDARQYIRTHLRDALTIEKVARRFYMSRSQFTRLFRQRTGQTFAEYLAQCRLEEAQILLRESTLSSRRIARYVGLRSAPYFSQFFTRSTGLTPRQFRNGSQPAGEGPLAE